MQIAAAHCRVELMNRASPTAPWHLFLQAGARRTVALVGLMLLSALTEGIGLLLLVPMLTALGGSPGDGGAIAGALGRLGIPLALGPLLALFVALVLLRAVVNHARALAAQSFEVTLVDGMRARAWRALLHCDWRVLSAMRQSDNASLLISEIDRVGYGVDQALGALAAAITLGAVGLAALAISPLIALGALAGGALVLLAYRRMRRRATQLGEQLGDAYGEVHARMTESLGALRLIKSFGREDQAARDGTGGFAALRRAERAYLRDIGLGQIALQGGGALLLALLVWLAITRWHADATTVLPLVALFARALPLLGALQEAWTNWSHASPALAAAMALIAEAESAREPSAGEADAPALEQAIVLRGVTVRFPGRARPALEAIDLTIPARQVTVLAGPSGAGKSTLADLLGGLIAPDEGQVIVDGAALDGGVRLAWRSRVTYVQQEPVLFGGTIRSNLLWACPGATESRLEQALRDASADFVLALPEGLDTRTGEGGRQLSGGERQRIVLARALLREPDLLILDEAASALDLENEAAIAGAIARLRRQMTIVVIAHGGALGALADSVARLDGGRLVASGA